MIFILMINYQEIYITTSCIISMIAQKFFTTKIKVSKIIKADMISNFIIKYFIFYNIMLNLDIQDCNDLINY